MRTVAALCLSILLLAANAARAGWTYEAAYGGSGDDVARAVLETLNGNYLLVGYSTSSGSGTADGCLIEVAPHSEQVWQKFVDLGGEEHFLDAVQLNNGDLIIVGNIIPQGSDKPDGLIVRCDSTGQVIWSRIYGGSESEDLRSVAADPTGNLVAVGTTASFGHGAQDVWVVKFNADGDTVWVRTFGGTNKDYGRDVVVDAHGNMAVSACSYFMGSPDVYMLYLQPNAATTWIRSFGTGGWDEGYGVTLLGEITVFVGYMFTGWSYSHDMLAVAMNASGDTVWTGHYGTVIDDYAYAAATTHDGYILLAGEKRLSQSRPRDAICAKIDAQGKQLWLKEFAHDGSEFFYDVMETRTGHYLFVGFTTSFGNGGQDFYLVKTDPDGGVTGIEANASFTVPEQIALLPNYPNPFNPSTHVRFELPREAHVVVRVKNLRGRVVRTLFSGSANAGSHDLLWDGRNELQQEVPSGLYICTLRVNGEAVATRKMLLVR